MGAVMPCSRAVLRAMTESARLPVIRMPSAPAALMWAIWVPRSTAWGEYSSTMTGLIFKSSQATLKAAVPSLP